MVNFRLVAKIIGVIIFVTGLFMMLPFLVSLIIKDHQSLSFLYSSLFLMLVGFGLFMIKPLRNDVGKREGYLIVGLGWMTMCVLGSIPYFYSLDISWSNAIFESSSGFTTTGATIFNDIEALPASLLFWRSLTQWIGGMGIIVFTVAIFPILGIGGVELFVAESPGPVSTKIHPRINQVAKRLWLIYVGLTFILFCILYFFGGMTVFDGINHAMTTMSTGGFTTKNASIAHFDTGMVQYPIMIFMAIAGTNFTIIYFLLRGRFKKAWRSDEFKAYMLLLLVIGLFVTAILFLTTGNGLEQSFRKSLFQVISIVTTTGYITDDYTQWGHGVHFLFFLLLFLGGCAGSTSGSIKITRHVVLFRNSILELKRLLHPKAFIRTKIDKTVVQGHVLTQILVFVLFYLALFVFGTMIMVFALQDDPTPFLSAAGSVATSLGNVGPAIGSFGPANNFAHIPDMSKWFLAVLMIIGRLEIFPILIVFSTYFWKSN